MVQTIVLTEMELSANEILHSHCESELVGFGHSFIYFRLETGKLM